jgi:hypothetical protein
MAEFRRSHRRFVPKYCPEKRTPFFRESIHNHKSVTIWVFEEALARDGVSAGV